MPPSTSTATSEQPIDRLNQLFLDLSHYIGEGVMPEDMEERIIAIEERYRSWGSIFPADLLWLQQTLKKLEG